MNIRKKVKNCIQQWKSKGNSLKKWIDARQKKQLDSGGQIAYNLDWRFWKGELIVLMERKPQEIQKSVKELEFIIKQLKPVFSVWENSGSYDPFVEVSYQDVVELKDKLVTVLEEYEEMLNLYADGDILFNVGDHAVQANPSSLRSGENAPAYKANLDGTKMYQLLKSGLSLNKIAKLFNCSPDTVKRRIYKIQQDEKKK